MHVRVYSFSRSTLSSNNVAMAKQISIWCWLGLVLPGENETFIFEIRTLNNTERWAPYPNWSLTTFSRLREEENSINAKILFSFQSTMEIFFTMKKYKIKYAKVRVWGFKRKQKTRVKVCLPHRQPHQSARHRLKGSLVNTFSTSLLVYLPILPYFPPSAALGIQLNFPAAMDVYGNSQESAVKVKRTEEKGKSFESTFAHQNQQKTSSLKWAESTKHVKSVCWCYQTSSLWTSRHHHRRHHEK